MPFNKLVRISVGTDLSRPRRESKWHEDVINRSLPLQDRLLFTHLHTIFIVHTVNTVRPINIARGNGNMETRETEEVLAEEFL